MRDDAAYEDALIRVAVDGGAKDPTGAPASLLRSAWHDFFNATSRSSILSR